MEKTYHLDLKTLLKYLRGKAAILRTTVTMPKQRTACQGAIYLKANGTTHCFIFSQEGSLLLDGTNAQAALNASTKWLVRLDAEQTIETELLALVRRYSPTSHNSDSSIAGSVPRPKNTLDHTTLQRFTPKQSLTLRTVLAMVNGERTIEQIKAQLRLPPELVEEVLEALRNIDAIE